MSERQLQAIARALVSMVKHVKRVPGLLISFWFFICYEKQEPVYILEEFVS